ncbi:exosortase/archaeosortase family protein [Singulisphaera rosea]
MASQPLPRAGHWRPRASDIAAVVLVAATLGISYATPIAILVDRWVRDANYSYGFLVIPIAAAIFWGRRNLLDRDKMKPKWWGFLPLFALLALRVRLYELNEQYFESVTLPLVIASLALAIGGWHLLRVAFPAIIFLFFMLPLPPRINSFLANPLQRLATIGSVATLQFMGLPVLAEGNVITVGSEPLEVAQACNGLSMLLSFVTLITAMVILIPRPLWERIVLMLSAIPIALASNIIRIVVTAWCYHRLGHKAGDKVAHDLAGLAMPVIALGLAFLELKLMSWLVITEPEPEPPSKPLASLAPR